MLLRSWHSTALHCNPPTDMKRISIAITDQLHRDLKTLAVYQDETLTSLVTRLLRGYLESPNEGRQEPPSSDRLRSQS